MRNLRTYRLITKTIEKPPKIKVEYPKMKGHNERFVQRKFNKASMETVYYMMRKQGYLVTPGIEMTGEYDVKLKTDQLLSILYTNYAYKPHQAHGLTIEQSLTMNMQTGQIYQLSDLFKSGSNYVNVLSKIISEQIKNIDVAVINPFESIDPNQSFYLTENNLVIYFQLYEIFPYYYGIPSFSIPYDQIKGIARKKGPIGMLTS